MNDVDAGQQTHLAASSRADKRADDRLADGLHGRMREMREMECERFVRVQNVGAL